MAKEWSGAELLQGKVGDVTFSTVKDTVVGTIAFDGHMYRLRTLSEELGRSSKNLIRTTFRPTPRPSRDRRDKWNLSHLRYRVLRVPTIVSPFPLNARMMTPIRSTCSCCIQTKR